MVKHKKVNKIIKKDSRLQIDGIKSEKLSIDSKNKIEIPL